MYWNGSSYQSGQIWITTTTANPWYYTISCCALASGNLYYLRTQLTDAAGNVFTSLTSTFTYNTTAPTVVINPQAPNNGFYSAVQVSTPFAGTANPSGTPLIVVSTITLSIEDLDGGPSYFNGSSWVGSVSTVSAQGTVANWTYNSANITFANDNRYIVIAKALDNSGNTGTSSNFQFVYDVKAPTSTLSAPAGTYAVSLPSINGTATDNPGGSTYNFPAQISTSAVQVAVKKIGGGWWNNISFGDADPNYGVFTVVNTSTTLPNNNWTVTNNANFATFQNNLVTGTQYRFISRTTDNAANSEFGTHNADVPAGVGVTVTYDTAPATSAITLPVNGNSYNALPSITGTASDPVAGVSQVQVALRKFGGAYFDPSTTDFTSVPVVWIVATGTGPWTLTTPAKVFTLSGFQFQVYVRALDNAGLTSAASSPTQFLYDNQAPVSAITSLTNGSFFNASNLPATISGTANDTNTGGSGISNGGLQMRILNSDGLWFNGVAYGSDSSFINLIPNYTDGNPGNWSIAISTTHAWADNHQYSVVVRAQDNTSNNGTPNTPNFQAPFSTVTFTVDETPPQTAIVTPPNNGAYSTLHPLTVIAGTANDPNTYASGVGTVQLSIAQLSGTTHYFNGTDFATATTEYMLVATGTSSWTYWQAALGTLANDTTYRIHAYATDAVGNVDTVTSTSTFVYDNDPPLGSVTFPANGDVQQNPATVFGTAADVGPAGIQKVQISLELVDSSLWYDPTTFNAVNQSSFSSVTQVWFDATGTTNWSYPPGGQTITWISGKHYVLQARAKDRAGNIETNGNIGSGNSFIITLPASQLQVVVDTTTPIVAGTSRDITVTALDNGGNVAITYTGTVGFTIDSGGPETTASGLPANYTFLSGDAGVHVFSGGLTPSKRRLTGS